MQDIALKTSREQWTIETCGKRGHDNDDDERHDDDDDDDELFRNNSNSFE